MQSSKWGRELSPDFKSTTEAVRAGKEGAIEDISVGLLFLVG